MPLHAGLDAGRDMWVDGGEAGYLAQFVDGADCHADSLISRFAAETVPNALTNTRLRSSISLYENQTRYHWRYGAVARWAGLVDRRGRANDLGQSAAALAATNGDSGRGRFG